MENLLEIREYTGEGYEPVIAFEGWRVAFLNYADKSKKENIRYLEKHELTDEVFVLLCGDASLYVADGEKQPREIRKVNMDLYKAYNVKKGVWHNTEMAPGSRILIIENDNTSRDNSKYHDVTCEMLP